jgi:hypothetical protein
MLLIPVPRVNWTPEERIRIACETLTDMRDQLSSSNPPTLRTDGVMDLASRLLAALTKDPANLEQSAGHIILSGHPDHPLF